MGFLNDLISMAEGGGNASGANATQSAMVQHVLGMVLNKDAGGLNGLLDKLKGGGLQAAVASWVSTGPNQSVTGVQIQAALGNNLTQQLASKFGISPDQAAAYLSQILPEVVNHLTPNGTVPQNHSSLEDAIGFLRGRLLGAGGLPA
jgi:uncharacterized protein YidB (DUF937 family)